MEPDVNRVEEANAMGSELRVEEVDGIDDVLAELIGQVVRVPYPKVRHSGCPPLLMLEQRDPDAPLEVYDSDVSTGLVTD